MATYGYSGSIVKVTVGDAGKLQAGRYDIVGYGGGGGTGAIGQPASNGHNLGGKGAKIGGYFNLAQGEKLQIIVGGVGKDGNAGGGGGFTEILANIGTNGAYVPLLVAGGGGGGGTLPPMNYPPGESGQDATVGSPGNGSGGNMMFQGGGGGAGAYGNGANGRNGQYGFAKGGADAANGAAGGAGYNGGAGGFGGGGGGYENGGGGGGYTGGAGGTTTSGNFHGAYGGTSLVSTKNGGTADAARTVAGENSGAGQLVFTAMCFASGTAIRIVRAGIEVDVAVEDLVVGDVAVTACGGHRPIRWIGRRAIDLVRHDAWPVRILAGAFGVGACGDSLPARDLWLSPGHPVIVGSGPDERLVPIMCLVNGTSIARVPVDAVTYWHVELDAHDILLAEGLPAESYIDCGNRPWFGHDAAAHPLADPDLVVPGLGARCRPVAIDGPPVEAERRRLDAMFASRLAAHCAWPGIESAFA